MYFLEDWKSLLFYFRSIHACSFVKEVPPLLDDKFNSVMVSHDLLKWSYIMTMSTIHTILAVTLLVEYFTIVVPALCIFWLDSFISIPLTVRIVCTIWYFAIANFVLSWPFRLVWVELGLFHDILLSQERIVWYLKVAEGNLVLSRSWNKGCRCQVELWLIC